MPCPQKLKSYSGFPFWRSKMAGVLRQRMLSSALSPAFCQKDSYCPDCCISITLLPVFSRSLLLARLILLLTAPPSTIPPLRAQQAGKDGPAFEKPLEAEAVQCFGLSKKARMGHLGTGGRPLRQMNAQRPRKSRAHVYSQPPQRYKLETMD